MLGLFRLLYDSLFIVLSPLILLYLLSRKDSRKRLGQYLGGLSAQAERLRPPVLLVHAVSVGEVQSVLPLVEKIKTILQIPVLMSTSIDDALVFVQACGSTIDATTFMCLDCRPLVSKLLNAVSPLAVIISETDIWPNFILECEQRAIPVFLVNGRISRKLALRAAMFSSLAGTILNRLNRLFVQSEEDLRRLVSMGVDPNKVTVTGNSKYEGAARPGAASSATKLRIELIRNFATSENLEVLVAGSTHEDEEAMLVDCLPEKNTPLLIIAPRDISRCEDIASIARDAKLSPVLWSELTLQALSQRQNPVIIVDSIGELKHIYSAASLVFVGGTFSDIGGHNFLEAAALGKAVILGPFTRNFKEDVRIFLEAKALVQAASRNDFNSLLDDLLTDRNRMDYLGQRAFEIFSKHLGSVQRTADAIMTELDRLEAENGR